MTDRKFLCEKCIDPFLEIVNKVGNDFHQADRQRMILARKLRKMERDRDRWKRKWIRQNLLRPAWSERQAAVSGAQSAVGELCKDFRYYSTGTRKRCIAAFVARSREYPPIPLPEPKEIVR